MKKIVTLSLLTLPFVLSACASNPATQASWACRAVGNTTCASIAQIDNDDVPGKVATKTSQHNQVQQAIFGAQPAAWWDRSLPTSTTREDAPRRESDQTMRIVVAPFVDGQGDYHDRTVVYAVMRKANWWVIPPEAVQSEPAPGTRLTTDTGQSPVVPAMAQSVPAAQTPQAMSNQGPAQPQMVQPSAPVAPVSYVVARPLTQGAPTQAVAIPAGQTGQAARAVATSADAQGAATAATTSTMKPIPNPDAVSSRHKRRHRRSS